MNLGKLKIWGAKYGYQSLLIFSYLILAVISLCMIDKLRLLSYGTDQFGYWGIAASITGYDWYNMLALNDYYSFGYSILLIPLFLLHRAGLSMAVIHVLSIMMNGCFLLLSFKMTNYAAGKLFPRLNRCYSLLISLITTLFVSNIAQIYTAWTELLLYFMFWCVVVRLIKVLTEPRLKNILFLLLSTAYIFTVHMRALGIVVSVGLILIFFMILNRKNFSRKQVLLTLITGLSLIFAVALVKDLVTNYIYANNNYLAVNDFSGQTAKVSNSFRSLTGLFNLLLSILGKLYYLGVSTWGLAFLALAIILFKLVNIIKRWVINKKITVSYVEILFIFIGMAGIAQILVNALYKIFHYDAPALADTIIHGRYTDFIIGPLLLIGFAVLPEISKYIREIIFSLLVLTVCTVTVSYLFDMIAFYPQSGLILRPIALPGMKYLFYDGFNTGAYIPTLISGGIFIIIILTNLYENLKPAKRWRISVLLLLIAGSVWTGFGLKATADLLLQDTAKVNIAEVFSVVNKDTDIYVVHQPAELLHDDLRNIQWYSPELSIQVITPDEFAAIAADSSDQEAIYISRADNYKIMARVSSSKKMLYNSGTLCIYAEPESEVSRLLDRQLTTVYQGGRLINKPVDLALMRTELSYQKNNGDLYYNFNRAGYVTWNTGLRLPDGIYEFTVEMEISAPADNTEIGHIAVVDAAGELSREQYRLDPQAFDSRGRGTIKVPVRTDDYTEPYVGIYNNGNCSMKILNVEYRQIQTHTAPTGNKELSLREIGGLVTRLYDLHQMDICYVDSDSSALNGFSDFSLLSDAYPAAIRTLSGILIPETDLLNECYYLVESTDQNNTFFTMLNKGFIAVCKNSNFILMVPDNMVMRKILSQTGLKILADNQTPIDLTFFYDTPIEEIQLNEMNPFPLPRGRYAVSVDFSAENNGELDTATIVLNGKEINITKEMLTHNNYHQEFELELTEDIPDVRLGLIPDYNTRIANEKITVYWIGTCYGYIEKIPTYDLLCDNAFCYADRIITDDTENSTITLKDIFLDFGDYKLMFIGQQTVTHDNTAAMIRIYRNGQLRTEEPLEFKGNQPTPFTFNMNEYEPAEWSFEITCPQGNALELTDFEIVR